jgi:hypothetical protein
MRRLPALPCAGAWALLLLAAPAARADLIPRWTEWWSASPVAVQADRSGHSWVVFSHFGDHIKVAGSSDIGVASLRTVSNAPDAHPDTFTHRPWTLVLHVLDRASHKTGTLTFHGWFDGTLSRDSSNLRVHFDPRQQVLHLGHWLYKVRLTAFAAPGPPGSGAGSGAISARVSVQHNPEPSGLVLAALGGPLLGLRLWRRRRAKRLARAA